MSHPFRLLCLILLAVAGLSTCAGAASAQGTGSAGKPENRLVLLNWANYTSPDLIARFEAETGIDVEVVEFGAMEDMDRLLTASPGRFDIAFPSHEWVPLLVQRNAVQRFEPTKLPGFANVEPQWTKLTYDPRNEYTIPFEWGTTAFQVDRDILPDLPPTLSSLFDPPAAARGKVGMLTDTSEVVGLAALRLGMKQCAADPESLARLEALLVRQRSAVGLYSSTDNIEAPADGRTVLQMQWNGPGWFARKRRPSLDYVYPSEGVNGWTVTLVLLTGAPHQTAAMRFLEWYLQPRNAALQSAFSGYGPTIRGVEAFLPPDLQNQPEFIVPVDTKIHFLEACGPEVRAKQRAVVERAFAG
jgi:spermidine/putrescine transport system substrate-binding protein